MTSVLLSLGSNMEREKNIRAGLHALETHFGALRLSPVYESESVGFKGSHFLNLVVGMETRLTLVDLSKVLKKIEDDHGRLRDAPRFSPRTLDIDILTYGEFVGVESGIELPRAEMLCNAFVLLPLSELVPDQRHPRVKKTYRELWSEYDHASQKLWRVTIF